MNVSRHAAFITDNTPHNKSTTRTQFFFESALYAAIVALAAIKRTAESSQLTNAGKSIAHTHTRRVLHELNINHHIIEGSPNTIVSLCVCLLLLLIFHSTNRQRYARLSDFFRLMTPVCH